MSIPYGEDHIIINVLEGENFGEEPLSVDSELQKALDDIAHDILSNDENSVSKE